ncbi:glucan biosynthesis protein G [Methylobacterium sp. Leaf117]|uniref:glucan biosynthesis protein n=1 Tax=Methylobacterium sp. Leaf117 TaxID=1736260 RepID=UPI0006FFAEBA|nr:glucan biosynthesis protein G [Methylobacterium sp. Leaf117]KQP96396.1 glucan biosynthesis protein G [Methylobacterium sp. Leaf117]
MTELNRRSVVQGLAATAAFVAGTAEGQAQPPDRRPETPFGFADVERRASDLAKLPYDARIPALPAPIAKLDYDAWRDIRFKPDKAFLGEGSPFRLQLFHLGFLYNRPVTVNLVRGGVATPIPYQGSLYDLGRTKLDRALPLDLGFAGIRIHSPLNKPNLLDELISFLGASYFRFLGRDQLYGLSARGIAVNVEGVGGPEEFPVFREFWIAQPETNADALVIDALLDGPSLTGAFRFTVRPGDETSVGVTATLNPRVDLATVGLAPLTSMYFIGENDHSHTDDYRPELHDSDGLQIAAGSGEWLWRPLENPAARRISTFADRDPKGFGLLQRDRHFEAYQDLEASYSRRPGYFVEPEGAWGEGAVMLMELPTDTEVNDNIVACWRPAQAYPAGTPVRLAYRVRTVGGETLHPGGQVVNTFSVAPVASGTAKAAEIKGGLVRRFLIDFAGGELGYYRPDPAKVEIVAGTSAGRITATSLVPNPHIDGFRAAVDVALESTGQSTDLRAFLKAGGRALTETWTCPWTAT